MSTPGGNRVDRVVDRIYTGITSGGTGQIAPPPWSIPSKYPRMKTPTCLHTSPPNLPSSQISPLQTRLGQSTLLSPLVYLALLFAGGFARGAETQFPSDAGLVNVKLSPYNARGDGTTDDTAAIQNAIKDNVGKHRVIYFPTGTYVVSDTLIWRDSAGIWKCYLGLQGQNRTNTIIKLKNSCAGYGSVGTPKAVIKTGSQTPYTSNGDGNAAFRNSITNLTVDTGSGNPGAIGIDYLANNQGAVEEVTIKSGDGAGVAGLSMTRSYPGPCLIKAVTVFGFNHGIATAKTEYSVTFEKIDLQNQLVAGIYNNGNVLSIRKITSTNTVPAISNIFATGLVTVVDGVFSGGSPSVSAIESVGQLYARNVSSTGYQSVIRNNGVIIAGSSQAEFVSGYVESLFPSTNSSLSLPVSETPVYHDNNFANWANVVSFGAVPTSNIDDTVAIQAAIDSGASTIYLPSVVNGGYYISDTIEVRGNVKKIVGFNTLFYPSSAYFFDSANPHPVFRISGANDVVFEGLSRGSTGGSGPVGAVMIQHASNRTLTLKHCTLGGGYQPYSNTPGAGPLFMEDVCAGRWRFDNPQNVWARQLNPENDDGKVRNLGGQLWILGLKTEYGGVVMETRSGGKTELLGGLLYPLTSAATNVPAFISTDSTQSLVYAVSAYTTTANNYSTHVQEIRSGVTKNLLRTDVLPRGPGSLVPLYSSAPAAGSTTTNLEVENLSQAAASDAVTSISEAEASGGVARKLSSNAVNDYITYTVPVPQAGTFSIWVRVKTGSTRGKFQLQVEGVNQATVDEYSAVGSYVDLNLGTRAFASSGSKVFNFLVIGKNASSSGYDLTFDNIQLISASAPTPSTEVIVDNSAGGGVTLSGAWTASSVTPGYYGSNYLHDGNAGKGSKSIRFTPNLPAGGVYQVFARWTSDTNRATNVPFDVTHSGGTVTVSRNQQTGGGAWNLLGTYNFTAGGSGSVLVRNAGTSGYVIADAVRFVQQ